MRLLALFCSLLLFFVDSHAESVPSARETETLIQSLAPPAQTLLLDHRVGSGGAALFSDPASGRDLLLRTSYDLENRTGDLQAFRLPLADPPHPLWSAAARLAALDPAERHIYTLMGSRKQELTTVSLSLSDFAALWEADDSDAALLIEELRRHPLGTILHSLPLVVGAPQALHLDQDYPAFRNRLTDRSVMAFVAANDGMLHAFLVQGTATHPAGSEAWAFIPADMQQRLPLLFAESHQVLLDLTPTAADVYDPSWQTTTPGSGWKTLLVGGARLGGETYFALDITDPAAEAFTPLWETNPFPGAFSSTRPLLERLAPYGHWAAILTSGLRFDDDRGALRALAVSDGRALSLGHEGNALSAGQKSTINPYYTLSDPVGMDSSGDGMIDLIYAGDSEGTLWKFFYDPAQRSWQVNARFHTGGRPITAQPALVFDRRGNLRVYFGTGRYLLDSDHADTDRNAFYGLIEQRRTERDQHPFSYAPWTPQTEEDLLAVTGFRDETELGAALDEILRDNLHKQGWYFLLDDPTGRPAERVIHPPLVAAGVVFFTTLTPGGTPGDGNASSRLYAVTFDSGLQARSGRHTVLRSRSDANLPHGQRFTHLGPGLPSPLMWRFGISGSPVNLFAPTSQSDIQPLQPALSVPVMMLRSWREVED